MPAQEAANGGRGAFEFRLGNIVVAVGINACDPLQSEQIKGELKLDLVRADGDAAITRLRTMGEGTRRENQQQEKSKQHELTWLGKPIQRFDSLTNNSICWDSRQVGYPHRGSP